MNAVEENLQSSSNAVARDLSVIISSPVLREFLALCLFETAYYFAYRYGMSFSHECASPFWFPDSVLLCALLLSRPARWWIFILALLPIRLFVAASPDVPQWFLLATFAIDSAKGLLTATILRRFIKNPMRLETVQEFGVFCLFAVLLIPLASAFSGAAIRHSLGYAYWSAWEQWFMGDALAQLIVTPAIFYLVLGSPWNMPLPSAKQLVEGGLLTAGLILTGFMAFSPGFGGTGFAEPRFYAPVPFLFWAAIRFGMLGASGAITIIAFLSVEAALKGSGPFSGQTFGGGPIVGVVSTSEKDTIREFNKKNHYNQWQFIYDPGSDRGGLLNTPAQPPLQNAVQTVQPGAAVQPGMQGVQAQPVQVQPAPPQ